MHCDLPFLPLLLGRPCAAPTGISNNLNWGTSSWTHLCPSAHHRHCWDSPLPSNCRPAPKQRSPSDYLCVPMAAVHMPLQDTLHCVVLRHLHTWRHASNSSLGSLHSSVAVQDTLPILYARMHGGAWFFPRQSEKPVSAGVLLWLVGNTFQHTLEVHGKQCFQAGLQGSCWRWGPGDMKGKPGLPTPSASPASGRPVSYTKWIQNITGRKDSETLQKPTILIRWF